MEIIYEPHPVSPERKAELRAKGLRIVDAIFKPMDTESVAQLPEKQKSTLDENAVEPKKRGRPAKE